MCYSCTACDLNSPVVRFSCRFLRSGSTDKHVICNRISFISSFLICMLFNSLCCHLIQQPHRFQCLVSHRKAHHHWFVPNAREKLISLSALSVMVAPCRTALSILGGGGGSDGPPGNEVGGDRLRINLACLAFDLCAAEWRKFIHGPTNGLPEDLSTTCFCQADFLLSYGSG